MQHKVLFTASLSNGETIYEGKGNYQEIKDAPSPWQRLLAYQAEAQVEITSLTLYTPGGQRFNLPSAGKNPRFHKVIGNAPVPVDYRIFRAAAAEKDKTGQERFELYTVAEASYADGRRVQMWVDEQTLNCWTIMI